MPDVVTMAFDMTVLKVDEGALCVPMTADDDNVRGRRYPDGQEVIAKEHVQKRGLPGARNADQPNPPRAFVPSLAALLKPRDGLREVLPSLLGSFQRREEPVDESEKITVLVHVTIASRLAACLEPETLPQSFVPGTNLCEDASGIEHGNPGMVRRPPGVDSSVDSVQRGAASH